MIGVILFNAGSQPFTIHRGDRIAQMVISRYEVVEFDITGRLEPSQRQAGGFGSTGGTGPITGSEDPGGSGSRSG